MIRQELEVRGYTVREDIFNTVNFALPQKRSRIYIFATSEELPDGFMFDFSENRVLDCFKEHLSSFGGLQFDSVLDILDSETLNPYKSIDSKEFYLPVNMITHMNISSVQWLSHV